MDTLPSEVLRDIFHQVIERNEPFRHELDRRHESYSGIDSIPLTISHTCRVWREMALSTSSFWSYLSLRYKCHEDEPTTDVALQRLKQKFELFETCLQRMRSSPLNFSVRIFFGQVEQCELTKEAGRMAERIIERLLTEQHRWRNVSFDWQCHGLSEGFRDFRADNMPLLSSLTLSFDLSKEDGSALSASINFAKSTHLSCFRLRGDFLLELGEEPMHTLTEWSELKFSENARHIAGPMCLDLLKAAPNLKQLHVSLPIRMPHPPQTPDDELQDPVQPHLRTLSFRGYIMPFSPNKVSFRALKALRFTQGRYGQLFAPFMVQHSPSLTFLELGERIDSDILIEVLCALPTLQDLRIALMIANDLTTLIDALAVSNYDGDSTNGSSPNTNVDVICPSLHSFHFYIFLADHHNDCIAFTCFMLESRRAIFNTFRRIRLRPGFGTNKDGELIEMPFTPEDYTKISRCVSKCVYSLLRFEAEGDSVEPYPFEF